MDCGKDMYYANRNLALTEVWVFALSPTDYYVTVHVHRNQILYYWGGGGEMLFLWNVKFFWCMNKSLFFASCPNLEFWKINFCKNVSKCTYQIYYGIVTKSKAAIPSIK